jgi:lipoate-protein ligase A
MDNTTHVSLIVHSPFIDPSINLEFEHRLWEHLQEGQCLLLFWKNLPSVFLGRSQNPWYEVSLPYVKEKNIHLLRRSSGGGTVYHDLGNLNITFMEYLSSPQDMDNIKRNHGILLLKALESLDYPCERNQRGDLLWRGKKISGSAYRLSKNKFLHHATLLMSSDLSILKACLNSPWKGDLICQSVKSVTSQVINILDGIEVNKREQSSYFENLFRHTLSKIWSAFICGDSDEEKAEWRGYEFADVIIRNIHDEYLSGQQNQDHRKGRQLKWNSEEYVYRQTRDFLFRGSAINPKSIQYFDTESWIDSI